MSSGKVTQTTVKWSVVSAFSQIITTLALFKKKIPSSQQPKSDRQEVLNEYVQGLADASPGRIKFAIGDGWLKG